MRRFLSVLALAGLTACSNTDDPYFHPPNEIVFGISQSFGTDGVPRLEADYSFIGIARQNNRYPTRVFTDGEGNGACYYERFDRSVDHAPSDPGTGVFTGGGLPASGLSIGANQPAASTLDGKGWASNDVLHFRASGFAMPNIDDVWLHAPSVVLDVVSVTPAAAIASSDDVKVTWTPTTTETARVMVALDTDEAPGVGGEIRCFTDGSFGKAVIPHAWIAKLFAGVDPSIAITGHLRVATQAQVTVAAPGNWLVYVVATSVQHDSVFTGTR